jgi:hypothetical protein
MTLAVAAPGEASSATGINGDQANDDADSAGAVYVFNHDSTWAQEAYVKASNTSGNDFFGSFANYGGENGIALSADGNILVVGAGFERGSSTGINGDQRRLGGQIGLSAAYVFSREVSTWVQAAYVKASNRDGGARFGASVDISAEGSSLAIGAWGESSNATGIGGDQTISTGVSRGAVYLY